MANVVYNMMRSQDLLTWTATQVAQWLDQIGLGQYRKTFLENKITGPLLSLLTDTQLVDLGMTAVGHRVLFAFELQRVSKRANPNDHSKSGDSGPGLDSLFHLELKDLLGNVDEMPYDHPIGPDGHLDYSKKLIRLDDHTVYKSTRSQEVVVPAYMHVTIASIKNMNVAVGCFDLT